jgi:hypothetical protein
MTTARRLPGGEVVILWEAQVSPLGLHSKQWLAHRNEFLPETKSKSISKVPKFRQCATSYEGAPIWNTPHGLGYRGWIRGTRLLCTLHGCPLAPAIQVIDVHFNFRVWPVRRLPVPRLKGLCPAGVGSPATPSLRIQRFTEHRQHRTLEGME